MMVLDPETEKFCPPTDKLLNKAVIVCAAIAVALLVVYFVVSLITHLADDYIPYIIFAYVLLPLEIIIITGGIFLCGKQLMRNVYLHVLLSLIAIIAVAVVIIVYIIAIALLNDVIPLPILVH